MKAKDIKDYDILNYLADRQGKWTCLWYGDFKKYSHNERAVDDVYYAMPESTPRKVALAKMKALYRRGFIGGCVCGCRGDFEITDKGLEYMRELLTRESEDDQ